MKSKFWRYLFCIGLLAFVVSSFSCGGSMEPSGGENPDYPGGNTDYPGNTDHPGGDTGGSGNGGTSFPATNVAISSYYDSTIGIGETTDLTAYVEPTYTTDSVTWSSSNTAIATVTSNGFTYGSASAIVEGVAAGTVTITVKAGSLSDSVIIQVAEPEKCSYSVRYYKQKLDGTEYELVETTNGSAEYDTCIYASDFEKEYEGFSLNTSLSDSSKNLYYNGISLNLYYTRNTYTITFDSDGGSTVTAVSGKYEETVTAPANPTKKHYTFDGWTPALPSTFTSNTTVKAKWKEEDKGDVGAEIY